MALITRSQFWYGPDVTPNEVIFAFREGFIGNEITFNLEAKINSPETIAQELRTKLNANGNLIYDVQVDRLTRKLVFTASGEAYIHSFSNAQGNVTLYPKLGIGIDEDKRIDPTYTAEMPVGTQYRPQFYLLDYSDGDLNQDVISSSLYESGSGQVEVVRFGIKRQFEFTIDFINNFPSALGSEIESDVNAVFNAADFMKAVVQKQLIEFMPDRNDPSNFRYLRIESTQRNQSGLGFKLTEKIGDGLADYYSTGLLVFREETI